MMNLSKTVCNKNETYTQIVICICELIDWERRTGKYTCIMYLVQGHQVPNVVKSVQILLRARYFLLWGNLNQSV